MTQGEIRSQGSTAARAVRDWMKVPRLLCEAALCRRLLGLALGAVGDEVQDKIRALFIWLLPAEAAEALTWLVAALGPTVVAPWGKRMLSGVN